MKRVLILMSTYNGERFLSEQIESIFSQKDVELTLLIRDDGSSDNTVEILKSYAEHKHIKTIFGKNIGARQSFFELTRYVLSEPNLLNYDYYAFSDQDDVWLPGKLKSAVEKLDTSKAICKLYYCRARLVDETLNTLTESEEIKHYDYRSCIYRNPALGCTMVFNRELLTYFDKIYPWRNDLRTLHDAWMFRCAYFLDAEIIADHNIHILYRQHNNNVTHPYKSLFRRYVIALKRKFKNKGSYRFNLELLYRVYHDQISDQEKARFLKTVIEYNTSFVNTFRYLKSQPWETETWFDKILWRGLTIFRLF